MNLVLTYNPSIVIKVHSVFGKNVQVRVRAKKLGCCCLRRTLRKCVRCACGCRQKSAHTKGLVFQIKICLDQQDLNFISIT